jgi:hypothetical protein
MPHAERLTLQRCHWRAPGKQPGRQMVTVLLAATGQPEPRREAYGASPRLKGKTPGARWDREPGIKRGSARLISPQEGDERVTHEAARRCDLPRTRSRARTRKGLLLIRHGAIECRRPEPLIAQLLFANPTSTFCVAAASRQAKENEVRNLEGSP